MKGKATSGEHSFCTLFDSGYLTRGLALIESIRAQGDQSQISVLCLDEPTRTYLKPLEKEKNLSLISFSELLAEFPELNGVKHFRSTIEFYFTSSPFLIKYSLRNKPDGHLAIYLDADLYFYGPPERVVNDVGESSVAIIEHNYPWFLRPLEKKYGYYNVGLVAFKKNGEGLKTLEWWASQCLAWCFDYPELGKYADQGYLKNFAEVSRDTIVLKNPGFNLAPWNTASSAMQFSGQSLQISGQELTFFHFHGLRKTGEFWVSAQVNYLSPLKRRVFLEIYGPYVRHLERVQSQVFASGDWPRIITRGRIGIMGIIVKLAQTTLAYLSLALGQALISDLKQMGHNPWKA